MECPTFSAESRILVHTPFGKDAKHLCKVLSEEGLNCLECPDMETLVSEIKNGVSVVLTTEEALATERLAFFASGLKGQPRWSAVPVLIFYSPHDSRGIEPRDMAGSIRDLSDTNFLQRPVSKMGLLSAVRSSLRDRARQYEMRDLLASLEEDIRKRSVAELELKEARRRAEEERLSAEAANRTKSQFLANMSHEIRTPLGAIMGFSDLISQPSTSREEIEKCNAIIKRNSAQLLGIIDDILDLSKVEAGRMTIEKSIFSLTEMISDFTALLSLRAKENNVDFRVNALTILPRLICSDQTRIRQILLNVVGNAIKFSPGGSVVLDVDFKENLVTFVVTDTGRGISEEQRRHLFQPFAQADASTTRKFGGTGLGLVLTKNLCEMMGGGFELKRSELGEGSSFEARILVETVGDAGRRSSGRDELRFDEKSYSELLVGLKVLLVEDSLDNQALIKILLSKAGAEVETAFDGIRGVELASENSYDVILMDVQMPRMDGVTAVQLLRQRGLFTPIIALTAHAMKEEQTRCLNAGFSSFLSKPVRKESLVQSILRLARK